MITSLKKSPIALVLLTMLGLTACGGVAENENENENENNRAPIITGAALSEIDENQAYSFSPTASDADVDNLTFSIDNLPSWASFNIETGVLSGTPSFDDAGDYDDIIISVSDGKETTELNAFSITVNNIVRDFTIAADANITVDENQALSIIPDISNPEFKEIQLSITGLPDWTEFDQTTGAITGTPTFSDAGIFEFYLSASDGLKVARHKVIVTVNQVITIKGKVIDGYISGANVYLDIGNDGIYDETDPSAITDGNGHFEIVITGNTVHKISHRRLIAEIGMGKGKAANDTSREDDNFSELPFQMKSYPVFDLNIDQAEGSAVITPFTHLVDEKVTELAVDRFNGIEDKSFENLITLSKSSIAQEKNINIELGTSDFLADEISSEEKIAMSAQAKLMVEEFQAKQNDSDNDGIANFHDAFPDDSSETLDTDSDGIGNNVDPDIDGDGILNNKDLEPLIYNFYSNYAPNPNASVPGYDMCVGDVEDDKLLCLADKRWQEVTSIKNVELSLGWDSIVTSGDSAGGAGTCALTNDGVYCLDGDFRYVFGAENPSSSNATQLVMGTYHMCFLDDNGVSCFAGNGSPVVDDLPTMINVTQIASTSGSMCALSDEGVNCWGAGDYNLSSVPQGMTFSNPKSLYASYVNMCVEDDNGIQCWGTNDYNLGNINYQSTSIADAALTQKNLCIVDNAGVNCLGFSDTFIKFSKEDVNNPGEYIVYGEYQQNPKIEFTDVVNAIAVEATGNATCLVDDNGISCQTLESCHGNDTQDGLECTVREIDLSTAEEVVELQGTSTLMCAFSFSKATCDGESYVGEITVD